jgi:hypothetical protein
VDASKIDKLLSLKKERPVVETILVTVEKVIFRKRHTRQY